MGSKSSPSASVCSHNPDAVPVDSSVHPNNKETQLLLEKTHYSLHSSCCSTNLQGYPSSMIFISSQRVRHGYSFPLKKRTFSYPRLFNPKFENVSLALHPRNFVRREHWHRNNYPCKKFSSVTWRLSTIHSLWTDRRMDERQMTIDNGTVDAYSIAVIKTVHQKLCTV